MTDKKYKYETERICPYCHQSFMTSAKGKSTAKFCCRNHAMIWANAQPEFKASKKKNSEKIITKNCLWCKKDFSFHSKGQKTNSEKNFCGMSCAAKWRMSSPERKQISKDVAMKYLAGSQLGTKRPDSSARMKAMNQDPEFKEKAAAGSKKWKEEHPGQLLKSRGGNGKLTVPQVLLSESLGWKTEVAVKTKDVRDQFDKLPTAYKVDIGNIDLKIAIEVDGESHRTKKIQALDHKKEQVLSSLGWCVLRFSNKEIMENKETVIEAINKAVASR